jgi:anti-anti-sigma factor
MSLVFAHEVGWDLHPLLEIWVEARAEHLLVTVSGEVTAEVAGQLRDVLDPYTGLHGQRIVVDASRLTTMDGTGLSVLDAARRRSRSHQGDVEVLDPSQDLQRCLTARGFSVRTHGPEFRAGH